MSGGPAVKLSPVYAKIEDTIIKGGVVELDRNQFCLTAPDHKVVHFVLSKLQVHGLTRLEEEGLTSLYCQFDDHDGVVGVETTTRPDHEDHEGFVEIQFVFEKHEDGDTMFKCIAELLKDIDEAIASDSGDDTEEEDEGGAGDVVWYGANSSNMAEFEDADEEDEEEDDDEDKGDGNSDGKREINNMEQQQRSNDDEVKAT